MAWSVSRLSSGEKQRLAVLRALAHGPQALLLDEPTANLDADSTARVERFLTQAIRAHGWPVLWVAHDLAQIAVVHVQHAAPGNAGRFQPGFRAPVQMVVDHRRQQIVR